MFAVLFIKWGKCVPIPAHAILTYSSSGYQTLKEDILSKAHGT